MEGVERVQEGANEIFFLLEQVQIIWQINHIHMIFPVQQWLVHSTYALQGLTY